MSVELTTDVTLNGGTVSVTVYEDTNQDGSSDNSETVSVADGTNTNTLSQLEGGANNDYWVEISLTKGDVTSTPSVNSAAVNPFPPGSVVRSDAGVLSATEGVLRTK